MTPSPMQPRAPRSLGTERLALARYLRGTSSAHEAAQVRGWLAAHPRRAAVLGMLLALTGRMLDHMTMRVAARLPLDTIVARIVVRQSEPALVPARAGRAQMHARSGPLRG